MASEPQRIRIPVLHNQRDIELELLSSVYDHSMARYYCLAYDWITYETFIVSYAPRSEEYYVLEYGPRNKMLNEYLRIVVEAHASDPVAFPWTIE